MSSFSDRCKNVTCRFGGNCVDGSCACGKRADCPDSYEPLCASDGKTVRRKRERIYFTPRFRASNNLLVLCCAEKQCASSCRRGSNLSHRFSAQGEYLSTN